MEFLGKEILAFLSKYSCKNDSKSSFNTGSNKALKIETKHQYTANVFTLNGFVHFALFIDFLKKKKN